MNKLFNFAKIFFLHLILACSYSVDQDQEILEDFTITELAQAVVDAQDYIQEGYKLSELDPLDLNSLKIIITKAINEDNFINTSINPANLVLALYKTYINPKSTSKAQIIKAYADAIEKSYNSGYFRIDITSYKTLTKQEKKEKADDENI